MYKFKPYYSYNEFLQNKFGSKIAKISVNGGYTCPNRDGSKSYDGCYFCNESGSGDFIGNGDILQQIKEGKDKLSNKWNVDKTIIYFQSFTSTYKNILELEKNIDLALSDKSVVGIAIATRCDCIDDSTMDLLKEVGKSTYLSVEIGLQTANESTRTKLNSCFTNYDYENAMYRLNLHNIDTVTHTILGLPNEDRTDIFNTIDFALKNNTKGIKLQLLHILKDTILGQEYLKNPFDIYTFDEYISLICDIIKYLPKDIVIHRLTGDGNKEQLIAPKYSLNKRAILNGIDMELKRQNAFQGQNKTI